MPAVAASNISVSEDTTDPYANAVLLGQNGEAYLVGPAGASGKVFTNNAQAVINNGNWTVTVFQTGAMPYFEVPDAFCGTRLETDLREAGIEQLVIVGVAIPAVPLLFAVGKYLIALYIGQSDIASSYGAAGALIGRGAADPPGFQPGDLRGRFKHRQHPCHTGNARVLRQAFHRGHHRSH